MIFFKNNPLNTKDKSKKQKAEPVTERVLTAEGWKRQTQKKVTKN